MSARAAGARLLAAGLVALALVVAPGALRHGVAAAPVLDDPDAAELAEELRAATEEQGICYGWVVAVSDDSVFPPVNAADEGSSAGPGRPSPATCPRYIVLRAAVVFTSESSEAEDSASWQINSNVPGAPAADALGDLGLGAADLLGDRDDVALWNAVLALPLLAAQQGLAPFVQLEPNPRPIPAADHPTGSPGSDFLRTTWPLLLGLSVLVLAGLLGLVLLLSLRARPRAAPPPPPSRPPP
jgi:hypothetical protein